MPSPLDFFQAGQAGGNASSFPGLQASNYLMDMFNKQMQMRMQMNMLLGNEYAKQNIMNSIDPMRVKAQKDLDAMNGTSNTPQTSSTNTPSSTPIGNAPSSDSLYTGTSTNGTPSTASQILSGGGNMVESKAAGFGGKQFTNVQIPALEKAASTLAEKGVVGDINARQALNSIALSRSMANGVIASNPAMTQKPGIMNRLQIGITNKKQQATGENPYQSGLQQSKLAAGVGLARLATNSSRPPQEITDHYMNMLGGDWSNKAEMDADYRVAIEDAIGQWAGNNKIPYKPGDASNISNAIINEPPMDLGNQSNQQNPIQNAALSQQSSQNQVEPEGPITKVSKKGFKYTVHKGA